MKEYGLTRYFVSLSSFAGLVWNASHWWARVYWTDADGEDHEADAQCRDPDPEYKAMLSNRFVTRAKARAAGIRLAHRLAKGSYHVVFERSGHHIDPCKCLSAPGNLRARLNDLWREFERLDGWEAPRDRWPEVQKICDRWTELSGDRVREKFKR